MLSYTLELDQSGIQTMELTKFVIEAYSEEFQCIYVETIC